MSVNASQANANGSASPGDSSVSVVNVVYTAANDGESSGAQAQGTASSSDFAGPTSAPSASTVSDLGETTASPSAELAQTTPTAASAPSASKGTTSGLGVTTPSPSAPLPQTTSTAVVNRGSGIGSSSAAEQTPGDEARTNLSSGTSSSSQAELTSADEGVRRKGMRRRESEFRHSSSRQGVTLRTRESARLLLMDLCPSPS